MPNEFIISPAYGRDYSTLAEALADWERDLDFIVHYPWNSDTYINRSDWQTYGNGAPVWVRFCGMTQKERLS